MVSEATLSGDADIAADEPMIIFWNSPADDKSGSEAAPEEVGGVPESEERAIPVEEEPLIAVSSEGETSLDGDTAPGIKSPESDPEILILGLRPQEGGEVISQSGSQDLSSKMIDLPLIRWIEIGLGVLALGLGITAIILRSKQGKIR